MNYNDNELIYMIRQNDQWAFNELYEKYFRLIMKFLCEVKRNCKNIDYEDVKQNLIITFYNSVDTYNENKGVFFSYLYICLQRAAYAITKEFFALKDGLNYQSISLDEIIDEEGNISLSDTIYGDGMVFDPKYQLIVKELEEKYENVKRNLLSRQETIIYNLLERGKTYSEIAKLLNLDKKQIYNSIERIKKKIKEFVNKQ